MKRVKTDFLIARAHMQKNSWIRPLVKIVFTIFVLAFLFRKTSLHELASKISEVDGRLVCVSIMVLFLLNLNVAIRWRIILRHFGVIRPLLSLWRFTMIGAFFNQFLPSGMGGDIFRIWYVQGSGVPFGRAVACVVVDRVIGLLGLFIVLAIGVPYLLATTQNEAVQTLILILVAFMAGAIAVFLRLDLVSRALCKFAYFCKWDRESGRLASLLNGAETCAANTRSLLRAWPDGFVTLTLSVINQTALGLLVFMLARGAGNQLELFAALFVFPFVLLFSMLPISVAGWGVRESAMVVAFSEIGMPMDIALGVSILFGICLIISTLPGACLWLLRYPRLTKQIDN